MSSIEMKVSNYRDPKVPSGSILQFEVPADKASRFGRFDIVQGDTIYDWRLVPNPDGRNRFTARPQGGYVGSRRHLPESPFPLFGRSRCQAKINRDGIVDVEIVPEYFEQVKEWRDGQGQHSPEYLRAVLAEVMAARKKNVGYKLFALGKDDNGRTIQLEVEKMFWETTTRIHGEEE